MSLRRFSRWAAAAGILLVLLGFFAEVMAVLFLREGDAPLPPLFGNFQRNRDLLAGQPPKEEFTFAVVGDTMSIGTFERLAAKLRTLDLGLAVLLGDCAFVGTEDAHRLLRAESAEVALPCPTFYVAGNHDVSPGEFTIVRFEETYGPSMFSFEYQGCLFIILRALDMRFDNAETLEFLGQFTPEKIASYCHSFAFMHVPPPINPDGLGREMSASDELMKRLEDLGIQWVFAGDYHGYVRVERGRTNYIVTGGGGGHLVKRHTEQFHHAVVVKVAGDRVEERIVPVKRDYDLEDAFEKVVFLYLGPYARQHVPVLIAANLAGAVVLALLIRAVFGRRRPKDKAPEPKAP
jgi:hypothetical protein